MTDSFDKCKSAMLGHAIGNNFQASTYMAIEIGKSLRKLENFNEINIMTNYLYLYYTIEYPMGDVFKLIYEQLTSEIKTKKSKLNKEHFQFSLDRIHNAVLLADEQLNGLSAGCNPSQRSYPLGLCPWISDENLFEISCREAALTHFSPQAGQVAGIINLICRRLIKGDNWNHAIQYAFNTTKSLLTADIKEIQLRYEHNPILNKFYQSAYAPNVLHTALHCVTKATSFEDALHISAEIDRDFSSTLVGLLAGARWNIPQSILDQWNNHQVKDLKQIAKSFIHQWKKNK